MTKSVAQALEEAKNIKRIEEDGKMTEQKTNEEIVTWSDEEGKEYSGTMAEFEAMQKEAEQDTKEMMEMVKENYPKNLYKQVEDKETGEITLKPRKISLHKQYALAGAAAVLAGGAAVGIAYHNDKLPAPMMKFLTKAKLTGGKYAPAIMVAAGVAGFGATAYLAYKSKDKVESVIADAEKEREENGEVNKFNMVKGITGAIALPVVAGLASTALVTGSYLVMNGRLAAASGALSLAVKEANDIRKRYQEKYGEEESQKFFNQEEAQVVTEDEEGNEKINVVVNPVNQSLVGRWFMDSQEYAGDQTAMSNEYNAEWIRAAERELDERIALRGNLLLNEVLEKLGFERTKEGALMGWTMGDGFRLDQQINHFDTDDGMGEEQIFIHWPAPHYIYDDVNFTGRYSIFG